MAQHRVKRTDRKPSFFWQGVLILAPMLVLAKLGSLALSQDQRMARHESELRAQEVADATAHAIWNDLLTPMSPPAPKVPARGAPMVTTTWPHVADVVRARKFEVDDGGRLVVPPPYVSAPIPAPLDANELSTSQQAAWETARAMERNAALGGEEACLAAAESIRDFLTTDPPGRFAAVAHFARGQLLARANDWLAAAKEFSAAIRGSSNALSEAGLPLRVLAQLRRLEMKRQADNVPDDEVRQASAELFRSAMEEPSALTPHIVRASSHLNMTAAAEELRREAELEWNEAELLRRIYTAARPQLERPVAGSLRSTVQPFTLALSPTIPPVLFWVTLDSHKDFVTQRGAAERKSISNNPPATAAARDVSLASHEQWLVLRTTNGAVSTYFCRAIHEVERAVAAAMQRLRKPEYLEASVRLAGHDLIHSNQLQVIENVVSGKGGGQFWKRNNAITPPPVLASARRGEDPRALLTVSVHLISPGLLYAQQEERAFLFKLLIGASALASVVGFLFAWRAFHKQIRLAEMKSNFVSSVSHELRAPIASVRLMAEGLERGSISDPAKQREYFRFITQECRRLSSMIENVLDFARIEQRRKQYEFEPTDLVALVQQTVTLMQPNAAERSVKLTLNIHGSGSSPEIPAVNVDGHAIQQALVNLIDNAIKHSPSGEEVVVGLELPESSTPGPAPQIRFSITDHGPGIPAAEHEKIFERFHRLGSELRRETPGVGIGLSIVKHIVEAHGGHVRVESEVGKGSRFTIELPVSAKVQEGVGNS